MGQKLRAMLLVLLSMPGFAEENEVPDADFIEFLAEFSEIEEDDFELLVFHALEDHKKIAATKVVGESDDE